MSEQEHEGDLGHGEPGSGTPGQSDEQTQVWPSPGAMVGITIPDPPESDASRTDRARSQRPGQDQDAG